MRKTGKRAFTLVELVIVIAVLSVLIAIGFVGGSSVTLRSRSVAVDSQMKNFRSVITETMWENTAWAKKSRESLTDEQAENFCDEVVAAINERLDEVSFTKEADGAYRSSILDPYGVPYELCISLEHLNYTDDEPPVLRNDSEIRIYVKCGGRNAMSPKDVADNDDVVLMCENINNSVTSCIIKDITFSYDEEQHAYVAAAGNDDTIIINRLLLVDDNPVGVVVGTIHTDPLAD